MSLNDGNLDDIAVDVRDNKSILSLDLFNQPVCDDLIRNHSNDIHVVSTSLYTEVLRFQIVYVY